MIQEKEEMTEEVIFRRETRVGFRAHTGDWPWMRAELFVPYDRRHNSIHADRLTGYLENEGLLSDYFYFIIEE